MRKFNFLNLFSLNKIDIIAICIARNCSIYLHVNVSYALSANSGRNIISKFQYIACLLKNNGLL